MAGTAGVIFLPSPAQVLEALLTVDGAGSGLDADLLDAQSSAAFESAGATATHAALTAAHGATGAVVGETNVQTLSGKTLTAPTIADFTNAAHDHLDVDDGGTLTAAAISDFTEASQDAVGAALLDTATIDLVYTDGTPSIEANVINDSITFAKMQNIATDRLIGRDTAATGDPEEISLGASLEWSGSASIQRAALTGDVTASANGNATTIAVNAVTDTKLRDSGALSVIGRSANSGGDPADISAVAAGAGVLRESGSTIGFGTVATAGIADNAITLAKFQDITSDRLLGRDTASSGDPEQLTVGGGVEFTGSGGIQRSALTGDVTATAGSNTTAIAANAVTNTQSADMAQATVKGRASGAGTGDPTDLTAAQVAAITNTALTAALLSDYSAGAWTPTIIGSGGGAPTSYTTQVGRYVKIGAMVTVWFNVTINIKGAAFLGNVMIGGLPFTIANVASGFYPGSMPFWATLVSTCVFVGIYGVVTTTTAQVTRLTAAAASMANMPVADIQNASRFVGTLSFEV